MGAGLREGGGTGGRDLSWGVSEPSVGHEEDHQVLGVGGGQLFIAEGGRPYMGAWGVGSRTRTTDHRGADWGS